jgi:hypothetical protein
MAAERLGELLLPPAACQLLVSAAYRLQDAVGGQPGGAYRRPLAAALQHALSAASAALQRVYVLLDMEKVDPDSLVLTVLLLLLGGTLWLRNRAEFGPLLVRRPPRHPAQQQQQQQAEQQQEEGQQEAPPEPGRPQARLQAPQAGQRMPTADSASMPAGGAAARADGTSSSGASAGVPSLRQRVRAPTGEGAAMQQEQE